MSRTFTLTTDQRATFAQTGLLHLPAFFPGEIFAPMADAVWADLGARFGIRRENPTTWTVTRPFQLGPLVARGSFEALGTPELGDLADALLGAGCWERPPRWGGTVLVTFPEPVFAYPRVVWHFDLPGAGRPWPFPVLRLFTFLEPVEPGGGGTLCIAGTATLAARLAPGPVSSKRLRKRVRAAHPALAALCDTPTECLAELIGVRQVIDGVEVVIEELSGEPGDAVIMHPLTLHAGFQNRRDRPRMMLAQSILAEPTGTQQSDPMAGAGSQDYWRWSESDSSGALCTLYGSSRPSSRLSGPFTRARPSPNGPSRSASAFLRPSSRAWRKKLRAAAAVWPRASFSTASRCSVRAPISSSPRLMMRLLTVSRSQRRRKNAEPLRSLRLLRALRG